VRSFVRPLVLALLACGAVAAQAADANHPATPRPWVRAGEGAPARNAANIGDTDREFITGATQAGLAEVAAGRLALQRSRNPRVREYAQMLVQDHQAANARLQQIAQAKGLKPPTQLSRDRQRDLQDLQRRKDDEFDQAFLRRMVQDHQKAIDLFGHEVKGRHQDGDLKNFAQQTITRLERHLAAAETLQKDSGHLPGA
jgi:putative membrane protein